MIKYQYDSTDSGNFRVYYKTPTTKSSKKTYWFCIQNDVSYWKGNNFKWYVCQKKNLTC